MFNTLEVSTNELLLSILEALLIKKKKKKKITGIVYPKASLHAFAF